MMYMESAPTEPYIFCGLIILKNFNGSNNELL